MSEFDIAAAVERTTDKAVRVDSGTLLLVDPCRLDDETLERLTNPNEHVVTRAVIVPTPNG